MKTNKVLEFIERRFSDNCKWVEGNCYYFAIILKTRFPQAVIWYDVVYGHFFVNIDGQDYDWTGKIERPSDGYCVDWRKFKDYDEKQKKIIERDCIK